MTIEKTLVFRPQQVPSPGIPMGARSVGAQSGGRDYADQNVGREMVQIFWFDEGSGEVRMGDDVHVLSGRSIAVYFPGTVHDLRSTSDYWSWRYWTMDGPMATELVLGFGLSEGIYPMASIPHALFAQLQVAIGDMSAGGERFASSLAYQLLAEASFPRQESLSPQLQAAIAYIDEHWSDAQLSIQQVARYLKVHRSILTRTFSSACGVTPIVYLTSKRIQHAQTLLKHSEDSVQDIAAASGFSDPSYFTRVFRQRCGMTPLQFRSSGMDN